MSEDFSDEALAARAAQKALDDRKVIEALRRAKPSARAEYEPKPKLINNQ